MSRRAWSCTSPRSRGEVPARRAAGEGRCRVETLLAAVVALVAAPAQAQMPDLSQINGKPLPVQDLPTGTISIRVVRGGPANAIPDAEVTASVTAEGAGPQRRTVKTGADGRATFDQLPPRAAFVAEVTVEGERLATETFPVPPQGGVRVMLIAGLGAAAPPREEPFMLGAVAGSVAPQDGLPAGTLELALRGTGGEPLPGREVKLGQVTGESEIKVVRATSDQAGVARFTGLPVGDATGYAAVIEHDGMRLGTDAFRMAADKGMRGEIRALERTADPSVLRVDNRSMIVMDVREEGLEVMQQLVFKNVSDKVFDPGEKGLVIPLPAGFVGAKAFEGGVEAEAREGEGIVVRATIPPNRGAVFAVQVRYGFILPAHGEGSVEVRQPLPLGMESPFFVVPAAAALKVEASGVRTLPDKQDNQGRPVKLYELPEVAPGGTLALTVSGLPARSGTGRTVVAFLCGAMVLGAIVGGRRPREARQASAQVDDLTARRDKLFAELVAVERERRAGKPEPRLDERRAELVAKLEVVYRELAQVEHGTAAAS